MFQRLSYLDSTGVTWTEPDVPSHLLNETPRSRKVRGMVSIPDMPVQHFELPESATTLEAINAQIWQRIEMATGLRGRLD